MTELSKVSFAIGDTVTLHSLSMAEFNGLVGILKSYDSDSSRWKVLLPVQSNNPEKKGLAIKEKNLRLLFKKKKKKKKEKEKEKKKGIEKGKEKGLEKANSKNVRSLRRKLYQTWSLPKLRKAMLEKGFIECQRTTKAQYVQGLLEASKLTGEAEEPEEAEGWIYPPINKRQVIHKHKPKDLPNVPASTYKHALMKKSVVGWCQCWFILRLCDPWVPETETFPTPLKFMNFPNNDEWTSKFAFLPKVHLLILSQKQKY